MDTIKIEQTSHFSEAAPWLFAGIDFDGNDLILLAKRDEQTCGALGAKKEADRLLVCSLFIEADYRRNGIGTALVDAAEEWAEEKNLATIAFDYACPLEQTAGLGSFFMRNGYPLPLSGNTLFTVSLSQLEKSAAAAVLQAVKPSQNIYPLRSLARKLFAQVPDFLLPEAAAGRPLPDLCLAYVSQGRLTAMLVMAEVEGGLHLHSAYLAEHIHAAHLMALLKQAWDTVRKNYPQYETMTVTGATESGYALIEKLLTGAEVSRRIAYHTEKALFPMDFMSPEYAAAIAHLQTIADILAMRGMTSALVMTGRPYLELEADEKPFGLYVDAAEFTLLAEYTFPPMEKAAQTALLEKCNAPNEPFTAFLSEKGNLFLRGSFAIGDEAVSIEAEKSIDAFILPFCAYLKTL